MAAGKNFVGDKRGGRGREQVASMLGTADISSDDMIYRLVIYQDTDPTDCFGNQLGAFRNVLAATGMCSG